MAVISRVDPALPGSAQQKDKIIWFLGRPHSPDNDWRLTAMQTINEINDDATRYEVSTFDYRETLETLEEVYISRVGKYRFSLAPMGSKMQAIGAALFAYLHPDVAIVLATPSEYNALQYSDGCVDRWIVNFGRIKELRQNLDTVGTLSVEE